MAEELEIRLLGQEDFDLVQSGAKLFDFAPIPEQTRAFLSSERDFIWFAILDEEPVGFVSASIIIHPDKPPHLFVNELDVRPDNQRMGIATQLIETVIAFGRQRKFWPVWLAAEGDDSVAKSFYRSLDGPEERGAAIFEWE